MNFLDLTTKTLSLSFNWSLIVVLIGNDDKKTKIGLMWLLIAIQGFIMSSFFQPLLTVRVFLALSLSCQMKFWQKESSI